MNNIKKVITLLVTLVLLMTTVACGNNTIDTDHKTVSKASTGSVSSKSNWLTVNASKVNEESLIGTYENTTRTFVFAQNGTYRIIEYVNGHNSHTLGLYKLNDSSYGDYKGIILNPQAAFKTYFYSNYNLTKTDVVGFSYLEGNPSVLHDYTRIEQGTKSAVNETLIKDLTGVYTLDYDYILNGWDLHDTKTYIFNSDKTFSYTKECLNRQKGTTEIDECKTGTYALENNTITLKGSKDQYGNDTILGTLYVEQYEESYLFYRMNGVEAYEGDEYIKADDSYVSKENMNTDIYDEESEEFVDSNTNLSSSEDEYSQVNSDDLDAVSLNLLYAYVDEFIDENDDYELVKSDNDAYGLYFEYDKDENNALYVYPNEGTIFKLQYNNAINDYDVIFYLKEWVPVEL